MATLAEYSDTAIKLVMKGLLRIATLPIEIVRRDDYRQMFLEMDVHYRRTPRIPNRDVAHKT